MLVEGQWEEEEVVNAFVEATYSLTYIRSCLLLVFLFLIGQFCVECFNSECLLFMELHVTVLNEHYISVFITAARPSRNFGKCTLSYLTCWLQSPVIYFVHDTFTVKKMNACCLLD